MRLENGLADRPWLTKVPLPDWPYAESFTNSIVGNRNLIRVGVAWTPEQVMPLCGTYEGSAEAFKDMDVSVTVTETAG